MIEVRVHGYTRVDNAHYHTCPVVHRGCIVSANVSAVEGGFHIVGAQHFIHACLACGWTRWYGWQHSDRASEIAFCLYLWALREGQQAGVQAVAVVFP